VIFLIPFVLVIALFALYHGRLDHPNKFRIVTKYSSFGTYYQVQFYDGWLYGWCDDHDGSCNDLQSAEYTLEKTKEFYKRQKNDSQNRKNFKSEVVG